MKWFLTIALGLLIGWAILALLPKKATYVQAPVIGYEYEEDSPETLLEAVGLGYKPASKAGGPVAPLRPPVAPRPTPTPPVASPPVIPPTPIPTTVQAPAPAAFAASAPVAALTPSSV